MYDPETRPRDQEMRRDLNRGVRLAKYVLGQLKDGQTDMIPRTGRVFGRRIPTIEPTTHEPTRVFEIAASILDNLGIEVETYNPCPGDATYCHIAVTHANGASIEPSAAYRFILTTEALTGRPVDPN